MAGLGTYIKGVSYASIANGSTGSSTIQVPTGYTRLVGVYFKVQDTDISIQSQNSTEFIIQDFNTDVSSTTGKIETNAQVQNDRLVISIKNNTGGTLTLKASLVFM